VGDRVFLTAAEGDRLLTMALDRNTGRVLWSRPAPRPRTEVMQPTNSPASPTPVSDGHMLYVFFGDFGLLAYSLDGVERWRRPLGPFNNANGHGSSPIVVDDLVVLICDQDTDSYLIALDRRSGEVRWKVERPEVKRMAAKLRAIRAQLRQRPRGRREPSASGSGKWCGGISNITPFPATGHDGRRSARTCCVGGIRRFGDEASAAV
jgi:hypothetical protein